MSDASVDFDYLENFAAGDMQVITDVLGLFQGQAERWIAQLDNPPAEGWRDLAHMIKGSARAIGASALGDVAERAEGGGPSMAPELRAALAEALAQVEGYLTRIGGG